LWWKHIAYRHMHLELVFYLIINSHKAIELLPLILEKKSAEC